VQPKRIIYEMIMYCR